MSLTRFVVWSIFSVFLTPGEFYPQANAGHNILRLGRDNAYHGMTSVNTRYFVTTFQEINFPTCVQNCLLHSRECAALLYSKTLLSCILLKCHLNDKLIINSTEGSDWEYWRNSHVCEEGWTPFAGHCYFFNDTKSTWNDAEVSCQHHDSYLVEMNSIDEIYWATESFILHKTKEECVDNRECMYWIGAFYRATSGGFVWSHSGNDMVIPEWSEGQPNNITGNQECVNIAKSGTANDRKCSAPLKFVCEKD